MTRDKERLLAELDAIIGRAESHRAYFDALVAWYARGCVTREPRPPLLLNPKVELALSNDLRTIFTSGRRNPDLEYPHL